MQPYFMPYIGYFQLINAVDKFVIYDDIKYTKKGWINRNRILVNGEDQYISLTLKKDSDYLNIKDRVLSNTWLKDKIKLKNRIMESYRKAPYYLEAMQVVDEIIDCVEINLFNFIYNSLQVTCNYLEIKTPLIKSSSIENENSLKSQDKVLGICKSLNAASYINPEGGVDLYDKGVFTSKAIDLKLLKAQNTPYNQYNNVFVPFLSIIDVLMFNDLEKAKEMLNSYIIIDNEK